MTAPGGPRTQVGPSNRIKANNKSVNARPTLRQTPEGSRKRDCGEITCSQNESGRKAGERSLKEKAGRNRIKEIEAPALKQGLT